ncbi:hypothetical protein ADL22_15200, partial [Streptomyces sp. NRRL F-4489]|uniref:hypothetical protein n=1 Tax=Streptomyces sp. NRRL F-4489 TaxID=1609095 RepID=UPI00074890D9
MPMNSAPHLLNEDRAEFARLLDEALRTAEPSQAGPASGGANRLTADQLRAMALSATTAIAACATAEYQHYVRLRTALRAPGPTAPAARPAGDRSGPATADDERRGPAIADHERAGPATADEEEATGTATADDEPTAGTAGFGLAAMATVLVPVLAGIAAVLFLLIGYVLRAVDPDPAVSRPLIGVGWIFAALAGAGALVAMGCLLVTALRNGVSRDAEADERAAALARAHDAWCQALLDRGLRPFLREALADPSPDPADDPLRYVPRPTPPPQR